MTINNEAKRFSFSGHESFQCRSLWLKKGFDFVNEGNSFNNEDAVVRLGVGKNMVSSIRFWMKAFDLLDNDDNLTEIAYKIFSDTLGWDPFLEDLTTLWLLHFNLVTKGYATTYTLLFNEFRKERVEFSKENFTSFVRRKAELLSAKIKDSTIMTDFEVMIKLYSRTNQQSSDREDSLSGLLVELGILNSFVSDKKEVFTIENTKYKEISIYLILYSILVNTGDRVSISFAELAQGYNSVGSIYAINRNELIEKLYKISDIPEYKGNIIFSNQAGVKELQFKKRLDPKGVLDKYYERNYAN